MFIALVRQRFLRYVPKALSTKEKKMITQISSKCKASVKDTLRE